MPGYTLIFHDPTLGTSREFHMAPSPEDVHEEEKSLETIVPLPGLQTVYRESHGPDIQEVQWRGTFGIKRRLHGSVEKSGLELFLEFKQLCWTRYQELRGSKDPRVSKGVKIEYHDWDQDKHMYASPARFLTPRSRDNKTFFRYDIAWHLYAPIKRKIPVREVGKFEAAASTLAQYNAAMEELTKVGEWLADKSAKANQYLQRYVLQPLAKLAKALSSFVAGVTAIIATPVRDFYQLIDGIASFIEEVGSAVGEALTTSINLLRNVRRASLRLLNAGELFKENISTALEDHKRFFFKEKQSTDSDLAVIEKEQGYNAQLRASAEHIAENRYQGAKSVRVRAGDTLRHLALFHLQDASKWRDIAMFNGLDGDSDLVAGQDILIPVIPGVEGVVGTGDLGLERYATQNATAERLYGRDVQVVQDSQGKLDVNFDATNDLSNIAGDGNLVQAVMLKTRIAQGTLLEEPDYGLRRLVGKRAHPFDLPALKHGLEVAAESDPRIVSAQVEVVRTGNRTDVSYRLTPVGMVGRRPVSSVVERV